MMTLVNVRLGPEDARRVAALKRAGVQLSRIVREAIRAAHKQQLEQRERGADARKIMAEIYRACPDPTNLPQRNYDLRDHRAARRAIVEKLTKRRPK